mmetsp:Transcript_29433/g.83857  ORF Transcript_29433/g.83857 Transcript_29433/m.83857 type:complete len:321 (-) Transcript_29433:1268-2230(-)
MVRPPSLCGSTRSMMACTSMPSARPKLSSAWRKPATFRTSLCSLGDMAAKASATCGCEAKQRRRRSSNIVDGAKMRMPRTNSTGSSVPSLSTSTSWKRVLVSASVNCTFESNSWKASGVFFCIASSSAPPCTKTSSIAAAWASDTPAELPRPREVVVGLLVCIASLLSRSDTRTPWFPRDAGDVPGRLPAGKPNSSFRSVSAMLRKRCRTLRRMSSWKREGSTRLNALMNSRRERLLLRSVSTTAQALLASCESSRQGPCACRMNSGAEIDNEQSMSKPANAALRFPYLLISRSRMSSSKRLGDTAANAAASWSSVTCRP